MTTARAIPGGTAAVIGAGTMGRGIAQTLAVAGYGVLLFDQNEAAAQDAAAFARTMLNRAAEKGRMSPEAAMAAEAGITVAASLADAGCGISVEDGPAPPAEGSFSSLLGAGTPRPRRSGSTSTRGG